MKPIIILETDHYRIVQVEDDKVVIEKSTASNALGNRVWLHVQSVSLDHEDCLSNLNLSYELFRALMREKIELKTEK